MSPPGAQHAGKALFWKAFQYGGDRIIYIARLLVLAWLLTPDDFGLLAIAMVAVDIMTRLTEVGMIPALVQRKTVDEIHYHSAWTVGLLRAALISGLIFLSAPLIAGIFAEPRVADLVRVLALRPLLEAGASIKVAELTRRMHYRALALIRLPEALANAAVAIVLAPSLGVWALVFGTLAGPAAVLPVSYLLAPYRPRLQLDRAASRQLIRFGRWIFLIGVIAVAGSAVIRAVISRQLGAAELGLYFLAVRLAFLPSEMAGQVAGEVTFTLYSRLQGDLPRIARAYRRILSGIYLLLLPLCALLIALAPGLVEHLLGPRWAGTVPVIRILTLVSLLGLLGETVVPILKGVGQPFKVASIEALQMLLLIFPLWSLTRHFGLSGAALAWLPATLAAQWLGIRYLSQILPRPFSGLGKTLGTIGAVSLAGAVLAAGMARLLPGAAGFFFSAGLALIIMLALLWTADRRLHLGLGEDLAQAFPRLAGRFAGTIKNRSA